MLNLELFLGFPINKDFSQCVAQVDTKIIELFVTENDAYLRQVVYKNIIYWGKNIGEVCDIDKLELLEKNVYSLLKKVIPDYPFNETPLLLFGKAT
ncbi:MAG: hypothetical protein H0X29_06870 [Parachlamydiaceae bacterium]|nr:hypothetical protein [Parachlamydiaceae bacterium]